MIHVKHYPTEDNVSQILIQLRHKIKRINEQHRATDIITFEEELC